MVMKIRVIKVDRMLIGGCVCRAALHRLLAGQHLLHRLAAGTRPPEPAAPARQAGEDLRCQSGIVPAETGEGASDAKVLCLLVVVAVFIPLAIAVMPFVSICPWALDRGFYENLLDDEALYEARVDQRMPDALRLRPVRSGRNSAGALNVALREVVTPDYLCQQSLSAIDEPSTT